MAGQTRGLPQEPEIIIHMLSTNAEMNNWLF